jgi:CBS domain-containing protein
MNVMKIARSAITIPGFDTVTKAIRLMSDCRVGRLMVVDGEELRGVFTEHDVMERVVLAGRKPADTCVRDVMTTPVWTIEADQGVDDALVMMRQHRIRRLPVVGGGRLRGVVSLRYMLRDKLDALDQDAEALFAYLSADGIGG